MPGREIGAAGDTTHDARQLSEITRLESRRTRAAMAPDIGAQFANDIRARDSGRPSCARVALADIAAGVSVIGCHQAFVASVPTVSKARILPDMGGFCGLGWS